MLPHIRDLQEYNLRFILGLKFPGKVSRHQPQQGGENGIIRGFARSWAKYYKILGQRHLGNASPDVGKGKMLTASDRMSSTRSFWHQAGVDPGDGRSHHAKMQMISHGHCIPGLRTGAADIAFQLFEKRLGLPASAVILYDLDNRQAQVCSEQGHLPGLRVDPDNANRTLQVFEHDYLLICTDSALPSIQFYPVFPGGLTVLQG